MTRTIIVIAAGLAFSTTFSAVPAHAQRARVFVASYGNDSNPCTFGSPCKTFEQAVSAVAAGGEVTAIDSAGFQPMTINKAVTITSPPGIEAGIAPSLGGNAITITAGPTDVVVLRGLTLEGAATGQNGIVFADGAGLEITDCVIRNFTQTGVVIGPGSPMKLLISNTRVLDNPTAGIDLVPAQIGSPPQSGGSIFFSFDHVTVNNNGDGIYMNSVVQTQITGTITNSVISSNVNGIIAMSAGSGSGVAVSIEDSSVSNHGFGNNQSGLSVSNNFSAVWLSHTLINNNYTGIAISNGGFVFSAGNNDINANVTPVSGGSLVSAPEQ